jgi:succinate dehydrogenase / fumarate reductase cytochrome b subunit
MANFFTSSIGKKFIQSISGAFLILFLLIHGTINFFSVIDSFTGKYGIAADDEILFSEGDGLFKLGCDFMSTPVVDIMVPILALGFVVHIAFGIWLSVQNLQRRGGINRYAVPSKAKNDSWSAKNMFVLGIIVLGFIGFHLTHFWAKMQLPEMFGIGNFENNPYFLLEATFSKWWILALYIVWFFCIWLHMNHGFWSMFQSIGWNNKKWLPRLRVIGIVVSTLIIMLFVATAVNAFIQANFIA